MSSPVSNSPRYTTTNYIPGSLDDLSPLPIMSDSDSVSEYIEEFSILPLSPIAVSQTVAHRLSTGDSKTTVEKIALKFYTNDENVGSVVAKGNSWAAVKIVLESDLFAKQLQVLCDQIILNPDTKEYVLKTEVSTPRSGRPVIAFQDRFKSPS